MKQIAKQFPLSRLISRHRVHDSRKFSDGGNKLIFARRLNEELLFRSLIRSSWLGLTLRSDIRYLLLWIALEALFGPDDAREMTFRLAQRIGFFLGADRREAKTLFTTAKTCYGLRSKVAHGRWKGNPSDDQLMAATEDLLRRAFLRLLEDSGLLAKFTGSGANRENYLDEIVFGSAGVSSPDG